MKSTNSDFSTLRSLVPYKHNVKQGLQKIYTK